MSLSLSQIYEEIKVGLKQDDKESRILRSKQERVREILSQKSAIYENETLQLSESNMFIQGSYGIDTAIKHPQYDVDADLGLLVTTDYSFDLRKRIFNQLKKELSSQKATVELKKPCISVDFKDGYNIDVAIYVKKANHLYYRNSIGGMETESLSKPIELVKDFKDRLAIETHKRKIIRLLKHFNNIAKEKLAINDKNYIPSISFTIFILDQNIQSGNLDDMMLESIVKFQNFVKSNTYNGPRYDKFLVGNTFYKVNNINEVYKAIDYIKLNLERKHYSQLTSDKIIESINKKNAKVDTSLIGTLGD